MLALRYYALYLGSNRVPDAQRSRRSLLQKSGTMHTLYAWFVNLLRRQVTFRECLPPRRTIPPPATPAAMYERAELGEEPLEVDWNR